MCFSSFLWSSPYSCYALNIFLTMIQAGSLWEGDLRSPPKFFFNLLRFFRKKVFKKALKKFLAPFLPRIFIDNMKLIYSFVLHENVDEMFVSIQLNIFRDVGRNYSRGFKIFKLVEAVCGFSTKNSIFNST